MSQATWVSYECDRCSLPMSHVGFCTTCLSEIDEATRQLAAQDAREAFAEDDDEDLDESTSVSEELGYDEDLDDIDEIEDEDEGLLAYYEQRAEHRLERRELYFGEGY